MTDCKGAFGFGYEPDIGGAMAAFAKYADGKAVNPKKPSAGMNGITAGGKQIKIVGYGCGNDTVPLAVTETKRLMEQLNADVMIGPLSGDEAVSVANYAKSHPTKTFIIGTAGSQDPTLQIAPPNVFRYHGDGAQWNAGAGEIAYRLLHWRKAAIIMDDYSFGWTSAAGLIADFCAMGGQITKRVFPPLNTTDYSPFIRQLPPPSQVDGYFWVDRRYRHRRLAEGLRADLRQDRSEEVRRQSVLRVPRQLRRGRGTAARRRVRRRLRHRAGPEDTRGEGVRGPGREGVPGPGRRQLRRRLRLQLLQRRVGPRSGAAEVGRRTRREAAGEPAELDQARLSGLERRGRPAGPNRQAIQDQWPLQIEKGADGKLATAVVGFVPNVTQSFGGLFTKSSPPPGRSQPPCKKTKTPWQGKIKVVKNGVVTNQLIK